MANKHCENAKKKQVVALCSQFELSGEVRCDVRVELIRILLWMGIGLDLL